MDVKVLNETNVPDTHQLSPHRTQIRTIKALDRTFKSVDHNFTNLKLSVHLGLETSSRDINIATKENKETAQLGQDVYFRGTLGSKRQLCLIVT